MTHLKTSTLLRYVHSPKTIIIKKKNNMFHIINMQLYRRTAWHASRTYFTIGYIALSRITLVVNGFAVVVGDMDTSSWAGSKSSSFSWCKDRSTVLKFLPELSIAIPFKDKVTNTTISDGENTVISESKGWNPNYRIFYSGPCSIYVLLLVTFLTFGLFKLLPCLDLKSTGVRPSFGIFRLNFKYYS